MDATLHYFFLFFSFVNQTIKPSGPDFPGANLMRGFGVSFSTHPHSDVDADGLADLAVGSHLSGHAAVLKRRRAVWAKINPTASIDSLMVDMLSDLWSTFELIWLTVANLRF